MCSAFPNGAQNSRCEIGADRPIIMGVQAGVKHPREQSDPHRAGAHQNFKNGRSGNRMRSESVALTILTNPHRPTAGCLDSRELPAPREQEALGSRSCCLGSKGKCTVNFAVSKAFCHGFREPRPKLSRRVPTARKYSFEARNDRGVLARA